MTQWLTIILCALLLGAACAWMTSGRRGLIVSGGLSYSAVLVWLLLSPRGDLAWPIPLFWVGSVAAAVACGTYVACQRAFRSKPWDRPKCAL